MKTFLSIFLIFSVLQLNGQATVVTAGKGDGIFSLLRKQGLDPVKYYSEFLNLNKDNLKNGSELYLGRSYIIPDAPDSFKKMAVQLETRSDSENAIFTEKELARVSSKSERLKNAVIYLLSGENLVGSDQLRAVEKQVMERLASQFMVHGAKVYLLENDSILAGSKTHNEDEVFNLEQPIGNHEQMQYYVDAINQRYLKNQGKYQRVLVMNLNKSLTNSNNFGVSIFHHRNSLEGERFANSLQAIFNQSHTVVQQENTAIFKNDLNLFLVKNVVPPITMITVHEAEGYGKRGKISSTANKKALTEIITSGVLKDYAELSVEEN